MLSSWTSRCAALSSNWLIDSDENEVVDIDGEYRPRSVASSTASAATPSTSSLPSFITLPSTFGNIHLGEPLNFALVVNNDAPDQVAHLTSVKVELQTSSARSNLLDANVADRAVLDVNQSTEFRAKHDIKELGMHILVVQVRNSCQMG
ncbi:hypothetical protein AMAG_19327 [Allomyces macrogynus ATCC 38327]|uniref:Trafficking protein particle complex subunit 13 N-terminal domain-containing protein n=1 Tax=Allomyces macrogynus (strain ATCC 38327) TaxID=578462 RepID=A0A0L0SUJ1_ALLM3|nr:hypothetical protein AMAG_19327 [Allomyces macrogynus ATCC 38327]|eukprot:KNE66050.1 hypothetical protein AMAG_19327 [Allomyces macrogynus ATCC 38327]